MIKRGVLFIGLAWASAAGAAEALSGTAQALSPSTGLQDEDVYYAPEESGDVSGEMGASQGAVGSLPGSASYLSHATLLPFEWGRPDKPLEGVELFLNGQYLGKSPLNLENFMVQRSALALTARKDGYEEGERVQVKVPVDGPLRIALLKENAASWYTTPAWLLGLGLIAGSVAAYSGGSDQTGIGLAAGGVGVIAISQLGARLLHMPALRRDVDAYNKRLESAP